MSFLELLLIGVGLSMDAFAVAICQGLCMKKLNWRYAATIALFFGGFYGVFRALQIDIHRFFAKNVYAVAECADCRFY